MKCKCGHLWHSVSSFSDMGCLGFSYGYGAGVDRRSVQTKANLWLEHCCFCSFPLPLSSVDGDTGFMVSKTSQSGLVKTESFCASFLEPESLILYRLALPSGNRTEATLVSASLHLSQESRLFWSMDMALLSSSVCLSSFCVCLCLKFATLEGHNNWTRDHLNDFT